MSLALTVLTASASDIGTFENCQAQYFHATRRYDDGLLATDRTAADVSSAIHDSLMHHHRQLEQELRLNRLPSPEAGRARLRALLERQLRFKRLNAADREVAARLALLEDGLDRAADLILAGMPIWARDSRNGDPLVWVEGALDHGPQVRAIQLEPGVLVRTRPDVIGLRITESGLYRPVVLDYKGRSQIVDPLFDSGILLRGIWVALEMQDPRCRWFLAGRELPLDRERVDLETVNLMHADGDEFLLRATLSTERLMQERDRFVETMQAMGAARAATDPDDVLASPSGLCAKWCPYLRFCEPGQTHVRKYVGEDVLTARLAVG